MSTFDRRDPVNTVRRILATAGESYTRVRAESTTTSEDATFFPAMVAMIVKIRPGHLHKQALRCGCIPTVFELVDTSVILKVQCDNHAAPPGEHGPKLFAGIVVVTIHQKDRIGRIAANLAGWREPMCMVRKHVLRIRLVQ
jgi:hypothetical protein